MAGTPEGYIECMHEGGATPTDDLDDEVEGDAEAPPRLRVEKLTAWHQELEEARLQLEQECAELEREIKRHEDSGRACVVACDVNQRIIEDDEALPHFTRASQNIAAAAALLRRLSGPTTPEDRRAHHEICTSLERAAA